MTIQPTMQYFRILILSIFLLIITGWMSRTIAQDIVGQEKLEKFPSDSWIYPYDVLSLQDQETYIMHNPTVQTSPGEFVYLWQEKRSSDKSRKMVKYNVLMETLWEAELKLEWEEHIIHMFHEDDLINIFTYRYSFDKKMHEIKVRSVGLEEGEILPAKVLFAITGKNDREIMIDFAPDKSKFLFYYFMHEDPNKKIRLDYTHVYSNELPAFKATSVNSIHFEIFNRKLENIRSGKIGIADKKSQVIDCKIDDLSNVYAFVIEKPEILKVIQSNATNDEQSQLILDEFMSAYDVQEPYDTHLPGTIGHNERVYLSIAERELKGRNRGTKAWKIVVFDFKEGKIDHSRRIETTSTLRVEVEKTRQKLDLKPMKFFDYYRIRELIEMPDKSLWLMVQKFQDNSIRRQPYGEWTNPLIGQQIEEMILFEFNPKGKVHKVIILPSLQKNESYNDRLGQFHSMYIDKKSQQMQFLVREPSEDDFDGPPRIFHRKVDLQTGRIYPRKMLFEGRRRSQYFFKAYTLWLSSDLVNFVMMDGDDGNVFGVTVNINGEEVEDEDEDEKKASKKARKNAKEVDEG